MRHPTEGVLRRLVDEPDGVSDVERRHVRECTRCLRGVADARHDASVAGAALAATAGEVDVDAAWDRLSAARAASVPGARRARTARPRALLRHPAAAAVAAALVVTVAGTAAANDWLQVFRAEQVAPVTFSPDDLLAVPDLRAYGDLVTSGDVDLRDVADAASAEAATGLDVPEVAELPRGVSGRPRYQVGQQVTATFTFSAAKAARAASAAGEALPTPPPGLDGSAIRLVAGPGVAQLWSSDAGVPALVVARAVAPTAFSSGVPFDTTRDYLLSLPGLPDDVAEQLRAFAGDGSTLPVPIPADRATTRPDTVDGVDATVVTSRDRTMAAVVWVDDGVVTVVAGSLDDDEVLSVARELR